MLNRILSCDDDIGVALLRFIIRVARLVSRCFKDPQYSGGHRRYASRALNFMSRSPSLLEDM